MPEAERFVTGFDDVAVVSETDEGSDLRLQASRKEKNFAFTFPYTPTKARPTLADP